MRPTFDTSAPTDPDEAAFAAARRDHHPPPPPGAPRRPRPAGPCTLPTHRPLFVGVVVGIGLLIGALTYLPVLALGPINEGLM